MAQPSFDSILNAVMQAESGGRRYDSKGNLLTSPKGAQGEMQVMPGTAKSPGFGVEPAKSSSPEELARVGRDYLKTMLDRYGSLDKALVAYNWGPKNADEWIAKGADPAKLPAETQKYVSRVQSTLSSEPRTTAQAPSQPEAATPPAPVRGAPRAAPTRVSEAGPADLGASYQAALALSFLADEDEREGGRREYDERQPSVAQQWLARETPKVSPESLAMSFRSPFPEEKPVQKFAAGGAVGLPGLPMLPSLGQTQPPINYATSKYFDPVNPFAAGQALNKQYGQTFQNEMQFGLPDMRQFGGRYAAELATEQGRRNFGRDVGRAQAEVGVPGGFYKAGDFDMLGGLDFSDPWTRANYANLFQRGNSYFIPDKVEADAHLYALHSPFAQTLTPEARSKLFDEMYYGGRFVNQAEGVQGYRGDFGPEGVMRGLLDYKNTVQNSNAPRASYANPYYGARDVLVGMDVGRGALTYDQAWNLSRAIEYQKYLETLPNDPDYQRAFSDYMKVVGTIDPTADLSSAELLRLLKANAPTPAPAAQEEKPPGKANGGFIAVGYDDIPGFEKGGEARIDRIKRTPPGVLDLQNWARAVAEDMYPREEDATKRDAARHMMASAIMANKTNPGIAEALGRMYELKEAPLKTAGYWLGLSKPRPDYPTDTANNALGTRFADVAKDPLELQRAVRASIERGEANLTPDEVKALGYADGGEINKASARGMLESLRSGEGAQAFLRGLTMLPQNIVGAPVDVVTMAMRPFGYNVEKPVGGSDWLKEKSRQAGVAFAEPADANARALYTAGDIASNLINPAGATRAAVRGVKEVGEQAGQAAKMLRELKPPLGPDLAPAGVPAEAMRKAPEKSLEELINAPMQVEGSRRDWERISDAMRLDVREGKPLPVPKETLMQYVQPFKTLEDGLQWVKIRDPRGLILEGGAMDHSINRYANRGGYGHGGLDAIEKGRAEVFSLRDTKTGKPLVTMEVYRYLDNGERRVTQIKGPANSDPSQYRKQIFELLDDPKLKVIGVDSQVYKNTPTGGTLPTEHNIYWQSEFDDWKSGLLDYRRKLAED